MNFKKIVALMVLLFAIYSSNAKAQITIGGDLPPASGAILQIKDQEASTADPKNVTATKGGFILPRVQLTNINSISPFPIIASKDQNGLVVYNVTDSAPLKPGIYVWENTSWVYVVSTEDPKLITQ